MAVSLLILAALQAPLVRELRVGLERKYRVVVDQDGGDHYSYRLKLKLVPQKATKLGKSDLDMDVRLTDYRATMQGQSMSSRLMGGGQMPLDATGLPSGLVLVGPQGPVWLPLLAMILPSDGQEGDFSLSSTPIGGGVDLVGKGTFSRKDGHPKIDVEGTFEHGGTSLGKVTLSTTVDRAGWPQKSQGTLISADGTYRFTLG